MKFLLGIWLGGLIEAIVDGMVGWPRMIAIVVFGSLSFLFILILLGRKLWPNRDDWQGFLLDSQIPLKGHEGINWKTHRPQQVGDIFALNIEKKPLKPVLHLLNIAAIVCNRRYIKKWWLKPKRLEDISVNPVRIRPWDYGKARLIDKIEFMRGSWSAAAYPKQWAVTLQGLHGVLPGWFERVQTESKFGENIIINLEHPEKVTDIVIKILEPRPNTHWAVGDIRVREIKLNLKPFNNFLKDYIR